MGKRKFDLKLQIAKSEARAAVMKESVASPCNFEKLDTTHDLNKKPSRPQELDVMLTSLSHLDPQHLLLYQKMRSSTQ